jgi:hypothetical protein
MVTEELGRLKLDRVPHPPYSPDLSPCNFWLFGMLKDKIKDRLFRTIEEIITALHRVWSEVTLDDSQSVFFNCMARLDMSFTIKRNTRQNDIKDFFETLFYGEIGARFLFAHPIFGSLFTAGSF